MMEPILKQAQNKKVTYKEGVFLKTFIGFSNFFQLITKFEKSSKFECFNRNIFSIP